MKITHKSVYITTAALRLTPVREELELGGGRGRRLLQGQGAALVRTPPNTLRPLKPPPPLTCDISPCGVGAVLSHHFNDGTEQLIAYASCTLTPAELKCAQIDKVALSIIFGVKHFHQYLFIVSDHKLLRYILRETKGIPPMASA